MNVIFILSDQHNPMFSGCYGHPLAETPCMDGLAEEGVRFDSAYCSSPLCVPTRAALFTGRHVFENTCWDNCRSWDGKLKGWSHYFKEQGVQLCTVGKLDFAPDADTGIETELLGISRKSRDIHSLYRENMNNPPRWTKLAQMKQSGPREDLSEESFHDHSVAMRACEWLENERPTDQPWILNVNFFQPHPGWPCPPPLWEKWNAKVKLEDLSEKYFENPDKLHPYHKNFAHHFCGLYATDEEMRQGHAAYLAHCELMDRNMQKVMDKAKSLSLLEDTLIIYASDHGENVRAHRMWGKMNMYEDSIRIPLVISGPGLKKGSEGSPVSHLDIFPTICEAVGLSQGHQFRGISLLPLAKGEKNAPKNEYVMSEYHANGAPAAMFALSDGKVKYVECVHERPMLFDLKNDPQELDDLILSRPDSPEVQALVQKFQKYLGELLSPQAVDLHAKEDQAHLKDEMEREGSLSVEIENRGYHPITDKLVPKDEFVPEAFKSI